MTYTIAATCLELADQEQIAQLLEAVYVQEGYTPADRAAEIFHLNHLRQRGTILLAKDDENRQLAGMIIIAFPDSKAKQIAIHDEVELQLFAVSPTYRHRGIGSALISAAETMVGNQSPTKIILSTQTSMHAAHRLYEKHGYTRHPARDWQAKTRQFMVYEKLLINTEHA